MNYLKSLIPATLPEYQLIYRIGRRDRYGKKVRALLYQREERALPVQNMNAVDGQGIQVDYSLNDGSFYRTIAGSTCTLNLLPDVPSELMKIAVADETEYMLEVYENYEDSDQRLIFWGYVNPESYIQDLEKPNPVVQMKAVDGIALLNGIEFAPLPNHELYYYGQEGALLGTHQIKYVIAYIFSQIGNRYDILNMIPYRWKATGSTNDTQQRLWDGVIDVSHYWGKTCRDVLEDIMDKMKAQIAAVPVKGSGFQSVYCVRLLDDILPALNESLSCYDRYGDWKNDVGKQINPLWPVNTITLQNDALLLPGTRMQAEAAVRKLTITTKVNKVENLIFNGDFALKKNNWWVINPLDEDKYLITPQGYMQILSANAWGALNVKKVFTNLRAWHNTSSVFPNDIRFRVRLRAKRRKLATGYLDNWHYMVELHRGEESVSKAFFFLNGSNYEWETFEHQFEAFSRPQYLSISALSFGFTDQALHIDDVQLYAERVVAGDTVAIENISSSESHILHEKSIRQVSETVRGENTNQYLYQNLIVRDQAFTSSAHISWDVQRINTSGGNMSISNLVKKRIKDYYSRKRRKIDVNLIHKDGIMLSPLTIVQDMRTQATYVISQMSRNLSSRITKMQLYEYADYLNIPPATENNDWILYTGSWADAGEWDDTETWKDTN